MRILLLLAHPTGLPHADRLGIPYWLQWLVFALALAFGAWLVLGARSERRASSVDDGPGEEQSDELLVRRPAVSTRVRPTPVAPAPPGTLTPAGLLVLLAGFVAGWLALDRVRAVDVVTGFIRTDGAAQVARLGFSFAALLWVGAALAPVAPRGSALAFGLAGAIGVFLATVSTWERRLEWWGAEAVLRDWDRLPIWAGTAWLLGLLALAAGSYRPKRQRPLLWPRRTKTAPRRTGTIAATHSTRPPDPTV